MNMKRLLYILPFIFLAAVSCKEDKLPVYHGDNYLHFTPGVNDRAETSYNFALDGETTRETEVTIPVQIRLWGYLPTTDVKCSVSVSEKGTTALASDYVNPESATFRKGYDVDTLWVTVRRRPELLLTDYKIVVNMDHADNGFVVAPEIYKKVTIHVTDQIPNQPVWWETQQALGEYSAIKYRLFNIFLNKVVTDVSSYTADGFKEEIVRFKAWLQENISLYPQADEVFNSIP